MASSTSRASAAGWKRRATPAAAKWRSFPPRTGGSAKAAKCSTRALRGTRPGCELVTNCWRDGKRFGVSMELSLGVPATLAVAALVLIVGRRVIERIGFLQKYA